LNEILIGFGHYVLTSPKHHRHPTDISAS